MLLHVHGYAIKFWMMSLTVLIQFCIGSDYQYEWHKISKNTFNTKSVQMEN